MRKTLIVFILLMFRSEAFTQQTCTSARYRQEVFANVDVINVKFATADPYGIDDSQDLFLDIYRPSGDTLMKRPVILYAYGGGFLIGTINQPPIPYYADFYAKHGYVFVSMQYRLGFSVTTPGSPERAVYRSVQDMRAAIRHLTQRAATYGIDTGKFILMGSSAGCFAGFHHSYMELSQAAAFATPIPVLDPEVLGGVDSVGNSDFGYKSIEPFAIINQWGALADTAWIEPHEDFPVISFHGDQDNLVPYEYGYPFSYPVFPNVYGSKPIHQRLDHLGVPNKLVTFAGFGHEPELLNPNLRDTVLQNSRDFVYPFLQPNTTDISGPDAVCTGVPVTYSVNFTEGSTYCWTYTGTPTILSQSANVLQLIWNDTGTVQVSVRELNKIGAEGTLKIKTTNVAPKVTANFGFLADELQVSFVNFSNNANSVFWSFGDGSSSSVFSPVQNYSGGGQYTVKLVSDNGVCADSFQTVIAVDSCPVALFTYTNTGLNGFFNATPTNTTKYFWSFGDGQSANVANPNVVHIYSQPGTYHVILKVVNFIGCELSDTLTVTIGPNATAQLATDQYALWSDGKNIFCRIPQGEKVTVQIFDAAGKAVWTERLLQSGILETGKLPSGLYLMVMQGPDAHRTQRIRID